MLSYLKALERMPSSFAITTGGKTLLHHLTSKDKPEKSPMPSPPEALASSSQIASYKLASIDALVRAHEYAHLMALGPYAAGSIEYDYVISPSGMRYAVGGSIAVDLKPVPGDPEATLRKAKAVLLSALAPAMPSAADKEVAAQATTLMQQAKRELAKRETADESQSTFSLQEQTTPGLAQGPKPQLETVLLSPQTPEEAFQMVRQLEAAALRAEGQLERSRLVLKAYQLEILAQRLKAKAEQNPSPARLNLSI